MDEKKGLQVRRAISQIQSQLQVYWLMAAQLSKMSQASRVQGLTRKNPCPKATQTWQQMACWTTFRIVHQLVQLRRFSHLPLTYPT